jgi:hypothetical protein
MGRLPPLCGGIGDISSHRPLCLRTTLAYVKETASEEVCQMADQRVLVSRRTKGDLRRNRQDCQGHDHHSPIISGQLYENSKTREDTGCGKPLSA